MVYFPLQKGRHDRFAKTIAPKILSRSMPYDNYTDVTLICKESVTRKYVCHIQSGYSVRHELLAP